MIFSGSILVYIEGFSPFVSSDISVNSIDGKSLQMCLVMPLPLGLIALKLIKYDKIHNYYSDLPLGELFSNS